jgi:hypothetical protein
MWDIEDVVVQDPVILQGMTTSGPGSSDIHPAANISVAAIIRRSK